MANTNEHPPEHTATPAPSEQAATPTAASTEPVLSEAIVINNSGTCFKQSCYSEGVWSSIELEHHAQPFDEVYTVFRKGTSCSIVRDHLDTLTISDDTRAETLEMISC